MKCPYHELFEWRQYVLSNQINAMTKIKSSCCWWWKTFMMTWEYFYPIKSVSVPSFRNDTHYCFWNGIAKKVFYWPWGQKAENPVSLILFDSPISHSQFCSSTRVSLNKPFVKIEAIFWFLSMWLQFLTPLQIAIWSSPIIFSFLLCFC